MTMNNNAERGDKLLIHQEKLGWLVAYASEAHDARPGMSSHFQVSIPGGQMPGVMEIVLNTNTVDVYPYTDAKALGLAVESLLGVNSA